MMVELLSPVQDLVCLRAAIDAGADAVYFGIKELNMRANAKNIERKDMQKLVNLCHKNKVKAYLALNAIVYDKEKNRVEKILAHAKKCGIDAIIAWDFCVINQANKLKLPVHISTQASIANFQALKTLKKNFNNVKRVVLARELSLAQIKDIIKKIKKEKINVGIEVFVHGAMCVSVSGRCLLSQDIYGRSANRGDCLQPCRRRYLVKGIEEQYELELGEEYVLSPKDLCTLPFLDKLLYAGITALKIEGRNKSPEYVKTVTEVYREAIDNPEVDKKRLIRKLKTVYNREFSSGFYMGRPVNEWAKADNSKSTMKKVYVGVVTNFYKSVNVAEVKVEAHRIKVGDNLMVQGNKSGVFEQKIESMQVNHKEVKSIRKGLVGVKFNRIARLNDKVFVMVQKKVKPINS
jgi:putative protease